MAFSFFPRTVYKTKSKISGEIEVKEQLGKYTLHVQGLIQSGGLIEGIWKKPISAISHKPLTISNVLVLGLGGGTVVQLIESHWPGAKIVGVEIDPEIIKIGEKFFGLGEIENLKIVNTDAFKWTTGHYNNTYYHSRNFYDLIVVDLYIGSEFSEKGMDNKFLQNLKKLLSREGVIIFNWLKNKDNKEMRKKLTAIFPQVEALDLRTNLFLICHP